MDQDRWQRRQERKMRRLSQRDPGPGRAFVGIVIIAVGALFLLQNLGFVSVREIWQLWPLILIALGISKLAENEVTGGLILTIIGSAFLARSLGYIQGDIWKFMWPLIVIGAGVGMLLRGVGGSSYGCSPAGFTNPFAGASASGSPSPDNFLNIHIAFTATERRINSQEFEGGKIHVAFGAAEIDLRGTQTKKEEIFIDAHAAFGGIELLVPDVWTVVLRGHGAFGVFEDKTHPSPPAPGNPRLIVSGGAAFGGVTVRN